LLTLYGKIKVHSCQVKKLTINPIFQKNALHAWFGSRWSCCWWCSEEETGQSGQIVLANVLEAVCGCKPAVATQSSVATARRVWSVQTMDGWSINNSFLHGVKVEMTFFKQ